jgi:hypothetical protein
MGVEPYLPGTLLFAGQAAQRTVSLLFHAGHME